MYAIRGLGQLDLCSASWIEPRIPSPMAFLPCHLLCNFRFGRAGLNHAIITWFRWTFVSGNTTQLPLAQRKPLVLKASEFHHLLKEGSTEKVYANTPEAEILDPELGTCCNGNRSDTPSRI